MKGVPRVGWRTRAAAGLLTLVAAVAFVASPWGDAVNRLWYDLLFKMRGPLAPPEEVLVVAIDEPSFGVLGLQWPWPRSLHAKLVDALFAAGARAVGLDLIFAEASNPDEDRALAQAVARHPDLVLAVHVDVVEDASYIREMVVGPHPDLAGPETAVGFVNLPVDPDGFVRKALMNRAGMEAFPLALARRYGAGGIPSALRDEPGGMLIDFIGPPHSIRTISYYQALDPAGSLPPGLLDGKLVLVGFASKNTAEIGQSPDHYPVPFTRWGGGTMAGVEIHASTAVSLLHGNAIRLWPQGLVWGLAALIWLGSGLMFFRFRPGPSTAIMAGEGLLVLGAGYLLFAHRHVYVPAAGIMIPVAALYVLSPFLHYLQIFRERNFIRRAFSTYLAPQVVGELLRHPERLRLGGEAVDITVLFLDVAGFTSISERLSPERLVEVLNRYLSAFTATVFDEKGMIDKYIGDAVMAVWGAPVPQEDQATLACRAALRIRDAVGTVRAAEEGEDGPQIRVRVGVNTGRAVAGNVGGERFFNYTVLGNEVNLASRLEGANKAFKTVIMVSGETAARAGAEFAFRELDRVRVIGKKDPVTIYELQGQADGISPEQADVNACYREGREAYLFRDWDRARECFQRGLALLSGDGPCRVMADRCRKYSESPPPPDWDGVYNLESK